MKILFIDDEPNRALPLVDKGHDVRVALGFDQSHFNLTTWKPDLICLDYDMGSAENGLKVAQSILVGRKFPVVVHSMSEMGAARIKTLFDKYNNPCAVLPIYATVVMDAGVCVVVDRSTWVTEVEAFYDGVASIVTTDDYNW